MAATKLFSLVIPAYKQQKTIVKDIENILVALAVIPYKYEIIVVVDGRLDQTAESIKKLKNKDVKVLEYEKNQGKGFAVKYGVLRAKGDIIGFIDAGMDLEPTEISIMLDIMEWNDADIVIGSKLHPDSKVNYPPVRKVMSWGYRTLTHIIFGFSVKDTQVGLKIYKRKVARAVFQRILVKRFAFDVEVLAVAYNLGYKKIYEAPIKLDFRNVSSIGSKNFWIIIFFMLWDTMAVFYRIKIKNYYIKQ